MSRKVPAKKMYYLVTSADGRRQVLLHAADEASADRVITALEELEERRLITDYDSFELDEIADFAGLTNDSHAAVGSELQRLLGLPAGSGVDVMAALDEAF